MHAGHLFDHQNSSCRLDAWLNDQYYYSYLTPLDIGSDARTAETMSVLHVIGDYSPRRVKSVTADRSVRY